MDRFRLDDPDAAEKAWADCPCRTAESREAAMVVLSEKVWCDPCLVPLIRALNDGGAPTVASCCGHGHRPGWIGLDDGRLLMILPDLDTLHAIERASHALFPLDINGDAIEQPRLPTRSEVEAAFTSPSHLVRPSFVADVLIRNAMATEDPEPEVDPAHVEALARLLAAAQGGTALLYSELARRLLASGRVQVTPQ